ncbi:MAG: hypothetical protein LQ350_000801 [Teloschistes chrysophthalmus]|nr:MAG: hypothetical protein LQ350_000801 [Niorma chrysophthalma]
MVKLTGRDGFERIAMMRENTVKTIYGSSSPGATSPKPRVNDDKFEINRHDTLGVIASKYPYHSSPTCVGMVPPDGHASTLLRKDQLEVSLREEKKLIEDGRLKEDNPLDLSEGFQKLCEACRRGDLKLCQETITAGVNINARDQFDYSPLILASLCGHYEVVQLLLESGALCERDTFQGERCLYNALNKRIRNLLLSYDYSKSTDPLQPFAAHITSLLTKDEPKTSDIVVITGSETFRLHKFVLSARSPYFRKKLAAAPETTSWKVPPAIPPQAFGIAMRYVYLGEIPTELGGGPGTGFSEDDILKGIEKISQKLEIQSLWTAVLESDDRRLSRQRRTEEVEKGRGQLEAWFLANVIKHKVVVDTDKANEVKWDSNNGIFADVLLRADEPVQDDSDNSDDDDNDSPPPTAAAPSDRSNNNIPIGPSSLSPHSRSPSLTRGSQNSTLFPTHRAILLRSDFFHTMFSSAFREAQRTPFLQIIPIDCTPAVLECVLAFLYTEKTDFGLDLAIDVLFAADLLLIERLKQKTAVLIAALGNGSMKSAEATTHPSHPSQPQPQPQNQTEPETQPEHQEDIIDIYPTIHAAWSLRIPRLETFAARYLAYRLESHIHTPRFAELIRESADRLRGRQETDSIELLDDVRYYLSERFRLRFEEVGVGGLMGKGGEEREGGEEGREEGEGGEGEGEGVIRTLDGEMVGDEFAGDAINYQILLGKIDALLEELKLDA